jgi:hypothetical protein
MDSDWQTIVVLACIAWAVVVVARRGWRLVRAGRETGDVTACSGCSGGCGPEVVRLEVPTGDEKLRARRRSRIRA